MKFKKDKVLAAAMVTATITGVGAGALELSSDGNKAQANTMPKLNMSQETKNTQNNTQHNAQNKKKLKSSHSNENVELLNSVTDHESQPKNLKNTVASIVSKSNIPGNTSTTSSPSVKLNSSTSKLSTTSKISNSLKTSKTVKDDSSKNISKTSETPVVTLTDSKSSDSNTKTSVTPVIHKLDVAASAPKVIADSVVQKAIADAIKNTSPTVTETSNPTSNNSTVNASTSNNVDYSKVPVKATATMNSQTGVISADVPTVSVKGTSQSQEATVRSEILALAASQNGTPYIWGASNPGVGFDCSGLTSWAYSKVGIYLPRTADEQYHAVRQVSENDAVAGDLVFFHDSTGHVYHVGIVVDANNKMYWEANHPGGSVTYQSYAYAANSVTYGSVFDGGTSVSSDVVIPKATAEPVTTPVTETDGGEPVNYNPTDSYNKGKPVSGDKPYVTPTPPSVVKVDPSKGKDSSTSTSSKTADSTPSSTTSGVNTTVTPSTSPTVSASPSSNSTSTSDASSGNDSSNSKNGNSNSTAIPTSTATPTSIASSDSSKDSSTSSTSSSVDSAESTSAPSAPSANSTGNTSNSSTSPTNLNISTPTFSSILSSLVK